MSCGVVCVDCVECVMWSGVCGVCGVGQTFPDPGGEDTRSAGAWSVSLCGL